MKSQIVIVGTLICLSSFLWDAQAAEVVAAEEAGTVVEKQEVTADIHISEVPHAAEVVLTEEEKYLHNVDEESFMMIGAGFEVEEIMTSSESTLEKTVKRDTLTLEDAYSDGYTISVADDSMVAALKKHMTPQEQEPLRIKGMSTPRAVLMKNDRITSPKTPREYVWFDGHPAPLMPYLDGLYHMGNTCIEPDPLLDKDVLSSYAQSLKAKMSRKGVYYSLNYGINYSSVAGPVQGDRRRNFVSQNGAFMFNSNILRDSHTAEGLFLTSKLIFGDGFGFSEDQSNIQKSIGSLQSPVGALNGQTCNLTQLALGYVGFRGKLVMMAGQIDSGNYMDTNGYSNYQSNNLTHGGFDRSSSLPLTSGSFAYHLAYQPSKQFYVLFTSSSNNTPRNHNPFLSISSGSWSNIAELGYVNADMFGLGHGIYRLLPFMLTNEDQFGAGLSVNIQQQLGKKSQWGYFFRAGWASEHAAALTGVRANVTTGVALLSPFRGIGASNAGYLGCGLLWLQGAKSGRPNTNNNEYGVEITYVHQLTPTMAIQPDIQVIKNPTHGRRGQTNVVFQVQNRWDF